MTEVDAAVGRIVDELRRRASYENTLVVFTGDNGYFHGEHGLADKWYPYEEALRVPLIVRDPRAGARTGASDARRPRAERRRRADDPRGGGPDAAGRDAGPRPRAAVPGRERRRRGARSSSTSTRSSRQGPHSRVAGVIRRDWKYIVWPDFDFEQLYDLKADPSEVTNLIEDPAQARRAAAMREKAESWRRSVR